MPAAGTCNGKPFPASHSARPRTWPLQFRAAMDTPTPPRPIRSPMFTSQSQPEYRSSLFDSQARESHCNVAHHGRSPRHRQAVVTACGYTHHGRETISRRSACACRYATHSPPSCPSSRDDVGPGRPQLRAAGSPILEHLHQGHFANVQRSSAQAACRSNFFGLPAGSTRRPPGQRPQNSAVPAFRHPER